MTASQAPATAAELRGAGLRVTAARVALLEVVRCRDPPIRKNGRIPMSENHDPVVAEGPTPESGSCPVLPGRVHPTAGDANMQWWPNRLNLKILAKNPAVSNPMGEDFDYAEAFSR